ncbi:MAG: large subunit ribosomal protein L29 [Candidatus Saganbacteria bacterium]|uniref:Large ribosomal subunit protein uL29 n=1 Tax=Candidatus Saganbacteria bacterium TaxID=2575572 RepID=A0A833L166_UNCSA|nr:MAG: large subunit ribosomal protein L29 [Candidatus Saganbacteria bacterium]
MIKELRELNEEDISRKVAELRKELQNLRFLKVKGELKNLLKIKEVRKNIARALTILKEKKK